MYERDYGMGMLWFLFLPVLLPLSLFIGNTGQQHLLFESINLWYNNPGAKK
jgi:hypothetical protein